MRRRPRAVDRVAEKSTAEMVVQPAPRHLIQRQEQKVAQLLVVRALPALQQKFELGHGRKLVALPETALQWVGHSQRPFFSRGRVAAYTLRVDLRAPGSFGHHGGAARKRRQLVAIGHPQLVYAPNHLQKAFGRKVQHRIQRMAIGGNKYVQWPSPPALCRLDKLDHARIQRRLQLTIDLDRDKVAVKKLRDVCITVAFPLHDMTPMAGEIPDRDVKQLPVIPRPIDRSLGPSLPRNGILGMHG